MCVILPLSGHEEQSDSYTFVKDCLSDFPEVAATDIQVIPQQCAWFVRQQAR